jgi:hypothetical protein
MAFGPEDPRAQPGYPVQFSVAYPDRPLNRLTTGLRIFTIIPIFIVLSSLGGYSAQWGGDTRGYAVGGGGLLVLPVLLMILFRRKYPRWWYDWNLQFTRFSNRVLVYLALMDDNYPSTDDEQSVRLDFPYPDAATQLSRGLPLVKWFLAIPHYVVLIALAIAGFFAVIGAWFAILFTGRYPRGIFDFVEGIFRWSNRVTAYAFTLVTDQYPPFRLSP